jgi:ABC-2 type transport system ATP-binding protein
MSSNTIIETRELTKKYGHQTAVDRLTFSVDEGEIFGFLGPNGAGKTTTLLMLLGLTEPSAGSATVLGVDPTREPIKVKTKIGYLQENMGFYSDLNAIQMLQFVGELNGVTGEIAEARIDGALQAVGLFDEAKKKIGAYSRGMRQRLGIAELLIKDSKVAFLDELFGRTYPGPGSGCNQPDDRVNPEPIPGQADDDPAVQSHAASGPENLPPHRYYDQGAHGRPGPD